MKRFSLLLCYLFLLWSCSDNDDSLDSVAACGVDNVVEDLSWLRAEIERREESSTEDLKYCYITIAEIEGGSFFIYRDCNPLVDKACCPIYDCAGNLQSFDKLAEVSGERIIWKTRDFACTLN